MMLLTWDLLLTRVALNKAIAKILQEKNDSKESLRIVFNEILKVVTYALIDFDLHLETNSLLFIVGSLFKECALTIR